MPVVEETIELQKTMRQSGQLRLKKVVHTELKHFTVPVRKEELTVERVPAADGQIDTGAVGNNLEEDVTAEVRKEEVHVDEDIPTRNRKR